MARKVAFTEDAARRIAAATLAHERGNRDTRAPKFRTVDGAEGVRIVTYTGAWAVNQTKTCTFKDSTAQLEVMNLFHNIGADCGTRYAAVFLDDGSWYLLVPQCG